MKAAYNYQFVTKDPGAFAHNSAYASELLLELARRSRHQGEGGYRQGDAAVRHELPASEAAPGLARHRPR